MQNQKYLQEDKIDLRELFKIIWNYKIFVLVFTSIITFIALIYVLLKNPISIYQGKMYLEIGQIQNKNFAPISIEKVTDLAYILNLEFKVNSNIPKNTFNLIEITFDNVNKNIINDTLIKVKDFVLEKHKEQTSFYESVIMTKQISDIIISNEPINQPKKSLIIIVAFVTAFVLSVFLVFLIQIFYNIRKEER